MDKLGRAITSTDIAEVVQSSSNEENVPPPEIKKHIVQVRVDPKDVPKWLTIIDFVLQEAEEQDEEDKWVVHCCKTFLRHEGKLTYVWSISLSSRSSLKRAINDVSRAIRTIAVGLRNAAEGSFAKKSPVQRAAKAVVDSWKPEPLMERAGDILEVTEMPLIGVTANRNKPDSKGKGAYLIRGE